MHGEHAGLTPVLYALHVRMDLHGPHTARGELQGSGKAVLVIQHAIYLCYRSDLATLVLWARVGKRERCSNEPNLRSKLPTLPIISRLSRPAARRDPQSAHYQYVT